MGAKKWCVARGGKNIIFRRGGIIIVFGPKYRPLGDHQARFHSDQMVLMMVRQEARTHERWPKTRKRDFTIN